jgi:hypothetical protein
VQGLGQGDHHPKFQVARIFKWRWRGTGAAKLGVARIFSSCSQGGAALSLTLHNYVKTRPDITGGAAPGAAKNFMY